PFDAYDGRVRVTQTLFDIANLGRVSAAKSQASAAGADRSAVIEASAQNVALAYTRATRAQAVLNARQADSALAAELVNLAVAQPQAGGGAAAARARGRLRIEWRGIGVRAQHAPGRRAGHAPDSRRLPPRGPAGRAAGGGAGIGRPGPRSARTGECGRGRRPAGPAVCGRAADDRDRSAAARRPGGFGGA